MRDYNKDDFIVRYPGVCNEKEQAALDQFWAEAEKVNHRGPLMYRRWCREPCRRIFPASGPSSRLRRLW